MVSKNRKLFVGKTVYVINRFSLKDSQKAYVTAGLIAHIYPEQSMVRVLLLDNSYTNYRTEDFEKMIFCTKKAANKFLEKIPNCGTFVYEISKSNNVVKRKVEYLNMHIRSDATLLLGISLSGKHVDSTVHDIGKNIFLTHSEAFAEAMKRKKTK